MQVMRDPVGVISKVNFIDDPMFSSSALSSPSCLERAYGIHRSERQDPAHFSPFGPVRKYSARPPTSML
jgi:hypothetical protein